MECVLLLDNSPFVFWLMHFENAAAMLIQQACDMSIIGFIMRRPSS